MPSLKIALFTETFEPKAGGVSTAHFNIYRLLNDHFNVKVFAVNENVNHTNENVVKVRTSRIWSNLIKILLTIWLKRYDSNAKLYYLNGIVDAFISVKKINRRLRKYQPDIIIVPDFNLPLYGLRIPVSSKVVWIMHHNYLRFRDNPLIKDKYWLDIDVSHSMEKRAFRKIDLAIAPSEYMKKYSETSLKTNKPVRVIPNFIDEKLYDEIQKNDIHQSLGIEKKVRVIYIPSAGTEIKGRRFVVEIIRRLSSEFENLGFFLSGLIPEDLNFELGFLKNVTIYKPGYLPWHENYAIVKESYITISPNLEENFSYALLEAQTAGIPVVAFDTGGNKEIVQDDQTGFIVPYLDIEALLCKTRALLNNPEMRVDYGENARRFTAKHFNNQSILEQFENAFKLVLEMNQCVE